MTIEEIKNKLIQVFAQPLAPYRKRMLVFWEDPEKEFADVIDQLSLSDVEIIVLSKRNLFAAKEIINTDGNQNILVYDPTGTNAKDDWLADARLYADADLHFDFYSLVMSEIGVLESRQMREVIKEYRKFWQSEERVAKFKSLCPSVGTPSMLHLGIIATLSGAKAAIPVDILFHLFNGGLDKTTNPVYKSIVSFGDMGKLWKVIGKYAGECHEDLAYAMNVILMTSLYSTMGAAVPSKVSGYVNAASRSECQALVSEWMSNISYSAAVSRWIEETETRLGLAPLFDNLSLDDLLESDLFPSINESILKKCFDGIASNVMEGQKIVHIIEQRKTKSWYDRYGDYFNCLLSMGQLLKDKAEFGDVFNYVNPLTLWKDYTEKLSRIDSDYRHIHFHYYKTTLDTMDGLHDKLSNAIDSMENIYKKWFLTNLNAEWIKLVKNNLENSGCVDSKVECATRFFDQYVSPKLNDKITFVILSDGMRYEVAQELMASLSNNTQGDIKIESIQSVFPSVTKYGMAALLPGTKIVDENQDIRVSGIVTNNLANRKSILKKRVLGADAISYADLVAMKSTDLKEFTKDKNLIYIYHNDIDKAGHDSSGESKVFIACEETIQKLTALVKKLCGSRPSCRILITADHGFIYTYKTLQEAEKLSIKDENIADEECGMRCIVTKSPISSDFLLNVKMLINNEEGSLMGYTPYQTIRLKGHGSSFNYVHGGVSLEEIVVPVIQFDSVRSNSKAFVLHKDRYEHKPAEIKLATSLDKGIFTNVCAFSFYQEKPIGPESVVAKYQIFLEDVKGEKISDVKNIVADKTDNDPSKRTFNVVLNLKSAKYDKSGIYYLTVLNAEDGNIVSKDRVIIDGDFSDDFGF